MASSAKWVEGISPDGTVEVAARRSLEPRLTAVAQLLPIAAHLAEYDIEHVHRLRVATRRAEAALKLYWDCLAAKPARWMKKRLRTIRRAAGDARDLDVLADRMARDYGEPITPIVDLIAKDRLAVQPAILHVAEQCREQDRYIRKTAKLLKSIKIARSENDAGPPTFQQWAQDQFAKVAAEFTAAMPTETSDHAALHEFRIRAKALRYAIELVAPACRAELRDDLYPTVEKLQERLGRIQDHVAAIERCQTWSANTTDAALLETLREVSEAEARGLVDASADFRSWWKPERVAHVSALLDPPAAATADPPVAHQM